MMNNQKSDFQKIEEDKKIVVNEVIKHNKIINNILKP